MTVLTSTHRARRKFFDTFRRPRPLVSSFFHRLQSPDGQRYLGTCLFHQRQQHLLDRLYFDVQLELHRPATTSSHSDATSRVSTFCHFSGLPSSDTCKLPTQSRVFSLDFCSLFTAPSPADNNNSINFLYTALHTNQITTNQN